LSPFLAVGAPVGPFLIAFLIFVIQLMGYSVFNRKGEIKLNKRRVVATLLTRGGTSITFIVIYCIKAD